MNKTQLIDGIAQEAGMTKADAKRALDAFIRVVHQTMKKGDKVTLVGFGTFGVVGKPARTGRNPQTGAPIKLEARKVVRFKPGTQLCHTVHPKKK